MKSRHILAGSAALLASAPALAIGGMGGDFSALFYGTARNDFDVNFFWFCLISLIYAISAVPILIRAITGRYHSPELPVLAYILLAVAALFLGLLASARYELDPNAPPPRTNFVPSPPR